MERRLTPRPQRVLVADDFAEVRELWRMWLTYWGFDVEEARNGAEAVERAIAAPPALVLMDLWMPVLDGLEAISRLKSDVRTADVPVLVISAQALVPTPAAVLEAGATAFVDKPCDPDHLLRHIRAALKAPQPGGDNGTTPTGRQAARLPNS